MSKSAGVTGCRIQEPHQIFSTSAWTLRIFDVRYRPVSSWIENSVCVRQHSSESDARLDRKTSALNPDEVPQTQYVSGQPVHHMFDLISFATLPSPAMPFHLRNAHNENWRNMRAPDQLQEVTVAQHLIKTADNITESSSACQTNAG